MRSIDLWMRSGTAQWKLLSKLDFGALVLGPVKCFYKPLVLRSILRREKTCSLELWECGGNLSNCEMCVTLSHQPLPLKPAQAAASKTLQKTAEKLPSL